MGTFAAFRNSELKVKFELLIFQTTIRDSVIRIGLNVDSMTWNFGIKWFPDTLRYFARWN